MNDSAPDSEAGLAAEALPDQPYPGLRPFRREEWRIFFGRELMIQDVVNRVVSHQLVAVHGDSGCGKSSLIAAGVMSFLERDQARAGGRWRTTIMRPEDKPLANLAEALAGEKGKDEPARVLDLLRLLNRGDKAPAAIAAFLGCNAENNVCILFDQFEELFEHARRHGTEEAELITEFLVGLAAEKPKGLHAILTMRSDYLGQCAQYRGFAETVNETQYLVPRMERPALMRAIREPAALYGGSVEPGLAAQLIADAGTQQDQLPLIQHGLMLMWRGAIRPGQSPTLTLDDYQAGGDLAAHLSRHADEIMAEATRSVDVEPLVEALFRALTDRNPEGQAIRRRQKFGELVTVTGASRETLTRIIDRFRAPDASFLRPFGRAPLKDDDDVDISHEAFIRNWGKISEPGRGWLDREAEDGLIWTSLRISAAAFERNPRARLSPTAALERARWLTTRNPAWAKRYGGNWATVSALITASSEAAERAAARRTGYIMFGAIAAAVICAALAVYAGLQTMEAQRSAQAAEAAAAEAAVQRTVAEEQAVEAQRQKELADQAAADAERERANAEAAAEEADRQRAEAERQRVVAEAAAADAARQRTLAEERAKEAMTNETIALAGFSLAAQGDGLPVEAVKLALAAWPNAGDELRPALDRTRDSLAAAFGDLRQLQSFSNFPGKIFALSPDGAKIVTGSADGTVSLWDARTSEKLWDLKRFTSEIDGADFSADGMRIALMSNAESTVRVWEAATGLELMATDFTTTRGIVVVGAPDEAFSASFSPDGALLVVAFRDNTARTFDVASGAPGTTLVGHSAVVYSAAFSSDGRRIVTASADATARIWDAASGRELASLGGHEASVLDAAFSPDGSRVVTASADKTARIWDATSGASLSVFNGHENSVNSAAFSNDGARIVTASADKTARVWDTVNGAQILVLRGHEDEVSSALFIDHSKRVATVSGDNTARLWDTATGTEVSTFSGHEALLNFASFSPDGRRIVTASADKTARVWDTGNVKQLLVLRGHEEPVLWAQFSPDGARIATAAEDKTARLWDATTGAQLLRLDDQINSAAFSPDGKHIVTISVTKGGFRVWDAATGRQVLSVESGGAMLSAVYAPDGKRIVTAGVDRTARVWDAATGAQIVALCGHRDQVMGALFSHDGRRIVTASADKTVRVWDATGGVQLLLLNGHADQVWWAEFSQDDSRIASASFDRTSRVWDSATGAQLSLLSLPDRVASSAFSPDGRRLLTASADSKARLWDVSSIGSGDAFQIACRRLGSNTDLSGVEARYGLANLPTICGDHTPAPVVLSLGGGNGDAKPPQECPAQFTR